MYVHAIRVHRAADWIVEFLLFMADRSNLFDSEQNRTSIRRISSTNPSIDRLWVVQRTNERDLSRMIAMRIGKNLIRPYRQFTK